MLKFLNKRLLIAILILVGIYTVAAWVITLRSEEDTTLELNVAQLKSYVTVAENARREGRLGEVTRLLPKEVRVTVIDEEGRVTFDTDSAKVGSFENHSKRQELKGARYQGNGYGARVSRSTGDDTFYYAEFFHDHYLRVGVPNFLTPKHSFGLTRILLLLGILILFFLAWKMYLTARNHALHLERLADLSKKIAADEEIEPGDLKQDDKTDAITRELLEILRQKEQNRRDLESNRERLELHFEVTKIGVGIFDKDWKTTFANAHFIQYAGLLSSEPITEVGQLLDDPIFSKVKAFVMKPYDPKNRILSDKMNSGGHTYDIQCIREPKGGFEITITDVTEAEKNRILKQELTSNITHELRTPLTAIRGYLEMLSYGDLSGEERTLFTDKALAQSARLSSLLDDISLLSKLEEPGNNYTFEEIDLRQLLEECRIPFADRLSEAGDTFRNNLPEGLLLDGNRSLLSSVFQNLLENSVRYAGRGVDIEVNLYHQDSRNLYLSYHDTGIGVDEAHLGRIFERFYRIEEGRSRAKGGTGLGLSIVRNAIAFHGGTAGARRHASGGLEIIFTLPKHHTPKEQ